MDARCWKRLNGRMNATGLGTRAAQRRSVKPSAGQPNDKSTAMLLLRNRDAAPNTHVGTRIAMTWGAQERKTTGPLAAPAEALVARHRGHRGANR